MSIPATTDELQSFVRNLSLSENAPIKDIPRPTVRISTKPAPKKARPVVADSWEDEADSESESELDSSSLSPAAASALMSPAEGPLDPPPTPISPQTSHAWMATAPGPRYSQSPSRLSDSRSPPARRPEKQTAVAGRLIAGALGIRAPKRTEEQRAYDRAIKEQEIKRRNQEREEEAKRKEEEERVKAAVWDA